MLYSIIATINYGQAKINLSSGKIEQNKYFQSCSEVAIEAEDLSFKKMNSLFSKLYSSSNKKLPEKKNPLNNHPVLM